ncbi:hypothetical protein C8Q77DRAFT_1090700 [Trametes polyzona]|nr:hypothetical protein C8Q77DRAFT_1090700 [Trametes polyzona]
MVVHTSTVISRSAAHIVNYLAKIQPLLSQNPLLYTISASQYTDSSDLESLVNTVRSVSPRSIGCLSAPIPSARASWRQHTAVSLAAFDSEHTTLFRSTAPGRLPTQVGRWHALHESQQEGSPAYNEHSQHPLPQELEHLSADDVHTVLYFTDNAPEGLVSSISRFGSATKLGMVGTSTPFVTGSPYTLFHNDRIYSDGAVGLCLTSPRRPAPYSAYPALESITRPMIVTSSEGNLVHALDNANPSALLLHALKNSPYLKGREQGISPELSLYLATLRQAGGKHEVDQLVHISAGDPSRGSIALDTQTAPTEGSLVQVLLRPPSSSFDALRQVQEGASAGSRCLALLSTSMDDVGIAQPSAEDTADEEVVVLEDVFLAASENGSLVARSAGGHSERPWKCTAPGALMGLQWSA